MQKQPEAPCAPPKAATPLEQAIYEYERRCDTYFTKISSSTPAGETPTQKERRLEEWSKERGHLEAERRKVLTLASMEEQLAKYRSEFGISTSSEVLTQMLNEAHHPTKQLAKFMATEGEPKPSTKHAAHHIVPGKGRWKQSDMLAVRINMHASGIRINDPKNGAWLPIPKNSKGHWATPDAPSHKSVHGVNYEVWISKQLRLTPAGDMFTKRLALLKTGIKNGTYPVKIEEAKDPNWDGRS